MTFFDCTADLVGQLNGNGQKGMLQIDAPPVENFWLRHYTNRHSYFLSSQSSRDVHVRHSVQLCDRLQLLIL